MSENRLTAKQRIFVEGCIANGGNATKAARDAGYKHPNVQGAQNLVKLGVREHINARIAEAKIHTDEVIGTLVSHMRADLADVYPEHPLLKRAKAAGVSHWIRKLTIKEYFDKSKQAVVTETSVELHNAQTAAKQLCAIMGLNVDSQRNPYDLARAAYERLILEHPSVNASVIADRVAGVYGVKAELLYE
jgi:hypothetical protein